MHLKNGIDGQTADTLHTCDSQTKNKKKETMSQIVNLFINWVLKKQT